MSRLVLILLLFPCHLFGADVIRKGELRPENSYLHVLVYSDGILAGLGHDHVIAATGWKGHYEIKNSTELNATIIIPIKHLIIDRQEDRAKYPHLHQKEQPASADIEATKSNMLGEQVLDVNRYPTIAALISGDIKTQRMRIRMMLRGHSATVPTDYTTVCENGALKIKLSLRFNHSDFGLTPYSALFGAIKVANAIDFHILAGTSEKCDATS
jgi:hypothetical protein